MDDGGAEWVTDVGEGQEFTVMSLDDLDSQRPDLVGEDFAALARAATIAPVAETLVVLRACRPAQGRHALPEALLDTFRGETVSVRCWLLAAQRPDWTVYPPFYNIPLTALDQVVAELEALTDEVRGNPDDRMALIIQRFAMRDSTVHAVVDGAREEVRLRACLGISEQLAEEIYYDHMCVRIPNWSMASYHTARKLSATVAAAGGTETVKVSPARQNNPALSQALALRVAQLAVAVSTTTTAGLEQEFALHNDAIQLVGCRP